MVHRAVCQPAGCHDGGENAYSLTCTDECSATMEVPCPQAVLKAIRPLSMFLAWLALMTMMRDHGPIAWLALMTMMRDHGSIAWLALIIMQTGRLKLASD